MTKTPAQFRAARASRIKSGLRLTGKNSNVSDREALSELRNEGSVSDKQVSNFFEKRQEPISIKGLDNNVSPFPTREFPTGNFDDILTPRELVEEKQQENEQDFLQNLVTSFDDKVTGEEIAGRLERETQIQAKRDLVNQRTEELNRIVSGTQASQLRVVGQGRGIPEAIIGGQQAQIAREGAINALPVAAQLEAAQGNLEMAQAHIDRMFAIRSEDARADFEYKNKLSEYLFQFADKKTQRQLAAFDKQEERNYNESINNQTYARSVQAEASSYGQSTLASQIANLDITDPEYGENVEALASQLKSPTLALDLGIKRQQLANLGLDAEKIQAEIDKLEGTGYQLTGDPVIDMINGSSRFGDQRLVGSELEKIEQSLNALGSLETLQSLLSSGEDGISLTGPITGKKRELMVKFGEDADAAAIKATIQGLIPTVARGIFGEVGVLTDADIENYKQTIPNLTSTKAQNKLISLVMYDVLSRNLTTTLTSNVSNQANVSGFLPQYKDAQNRITALKEDLGVFNSPIQVNTDGSVTIDTPEGAETGQPDVDWWGIGGSLPPLPAFGPIEFNR